jgi:DNA-directed RNA polymerase subunit H
MIFGDCVDSRVIKSVEEIKHELVPKHEILSGKEKEAVLKKFDAREDELPKILLADPITEMIGAKLGDIVKITRKSQTAGQAIYYRIVVKK